MGKLALKYRHAIACGSCTDRLTVDRVIDGAKIALCLTDPPYGLGDSATAKNNYDQHIDTAENLDGLIALFLPIAREVADAVLLSPGNANVRRYPAPTWTLAWFSPSNTGSGPWGFCAWQPILAYGADPMLKNKKGRHPDALVQSEIPEKNGHPCPKPVGVWSWFMERGSLRGKVVYEPFCGSGTTIIAAEKTHRQVRAIELSPAYVDISVVRWQNFTGETAVNRDTGETFAERVNGSPRP